MEIRYDKLADAAYFKLKKGKVSKTKEFADKVLIDLDKMGNVLGVEILNASLKFPKQKSISSIFKATVPFVAA